MSSSKSSSASTSSDPTSSSAGRSWRCCCCCCCCTSDALLIGSVVTSCVCASLSTFAVRPFVGRRRQSRLQHHRRFSPLFALSAHRHSVVNGCRSLRTPPPPSSSSYRPWPIRWTPNGGRLAVFPINCSLNRTTLTFMANFSAFLRSESPSHLGTKNHIMYVQCTDEHRMLQI